MTRIIGISGSLRRGSFNTALLRAAAEVAPEGTTITVETLHGVPLYDGDAEAANGIPDAVRRLKDAITSSDGLLLVTPEYNNSIPGVFKNAIDWLSRPPKDSSRVFGNLPVAVMGASAGNFATVQAQTAWLPVLRTLATNSWFGGRLLVPRAAQAFDDEGRLIDDDIRGRLAEFIAGFAEFAKENSRL